MIGWQSNATNFMLNPHSGAKDNSKIFGMCGEYTALAYPLSELL